MLLKILYFLANFFPKFSANLMDICKNAKIHLVWWHMAAEGGDAEAMLALACLHEKGHGVTQSSAEAANWRRRAAQV